MEKVIDHILNRTLQRYPLPFPQTQERSSCDIIKTYQVTVYIDEETVFRHTGMPFVILSHLGVNIVKDLLETLMSLFSKYNESAIENIFDLPEIRDAEHFHVYKDSVSIQDMGYDPNRNVFRYTFYVPVALTGMPASSTPDMPAYLPSGMMPNNPPPHKLTGRTLSVDEVIAEIDEAVEAQEKNE